MHDGQEEEERASEETLPDTPLHAYGQGREEDIVGDPDKLKSSDPEDARRTEVADGEDVESPDPPPKH